MPALHTILAAEHYGHGKSGHSLSQGITLMLQQLVPTYSSTCSSMTASAYAVVAVAAELQSDDSTQ